MKERIKKAAGRVWWLEQELEAAEAKYEALLHQAMKDGALKTSAAGRKVDRSNVTPAEKKMWTYMKTLSEPTSHEDIAEATGLHAGTVRRFLAGGKRRGVIEKVEVNRWKIVEELLIED